MEADRLLLEGSKEISKMANASSKSLEMLSNLLIALLEESMPVGSQAPRAAMAEALRAVSIAASDRTGGVSGELDPAVLKPAEQHWVAVTKYMASAQKLAEHWVAVTRYIASLERRPMRADELEVLGELIDSAPSATMLFSDLFESSSITENTIQNLADDGLVEIGCAGEEHFASLTAAGLRAYGREMGKDEAEIEAVIVEHGMK
jgi:hypothetical protein